MRYLYLCSINLGSTAQICKVDALDALDARDAVDQAFIVFNNKNISHSDIGVIQSANTLSVSDYFKELVRRLKIPKADGT